MGLVFIPRTRPTLPTVEEMRVGRPVRGRTAGGLADGANHMSGWRITRRIAQIFDSAVDATTHATTQVTGEGWMRWDTGPHATHLWVAITYYGEDRGATAAEPVIDVALETPAGVVLDPGVRFRRDDGTLPLRDEDRDLGVAVLHIYTEGRAPRPGEGLSQTGPRPLVLPAPGTDVVLHLDWANARVYTVSAFEVYQEAIAI